MTATTEEDEDPGERSADEQSRMSRLLSVPSVEDAPSGSEEDSGPAYEQHGQVCALFAGGSVGCEPFILKHQVPSSRAGFL